MALAALNTGTLALLGHMNERNWSAGAWVLGIIGFVLLVTLVVLVIYLLVRVFSHQHVEGTAGAYPPPPATADPLDIARHRYATGEINKEQFEDIQKTLKGDT